MCKSSPEREIRMWGPWGVLGVKMCYYPILGVALNFRENEVLELFHFSVCVI